MIRSTTSRWLAVSVVALACSPWVTLTNGAAATRDKAEAVVTSDPRLDMITALRAMGPYPGLGDQAALFDRLIGTWDVEYTDFSTNGKITHRSGQFIVGWIMDGRVLQDFWIVDPSGTRRDREVYTDLRYYDPKSGTWPSTFIDPEHTSAARFTGRPSGVDRMEFDTQDFGGAYTRWSINDLGPSSFVWREEESLDSGKTWRVTAEHHMKRHTASAAAPQTLGIGVRRLIPALA
jgi:hypothetical protein